MVLKTFVKRKKGGALIRTDLQWHNQFFESKRVLVSETEKGVAFHVDSETASGITGFDIDLNSMGYELYNDNGLLIERVVTANEEKGE